MGPRRLTSLPKQDSLCWGIDYPSGQGECFVSLLLVSNIRESFIYQVLVYMLCSRSCLLRMIKGTWIFMPTGKKGWCWLVSSGWTLLQAAQPSSGPCLRLRPACPALLSFSKLPGMKLPTSSHSDLGVLSSLRSIVKGSAAISGSPLLFAPRMTSTQAPFAVCHLLQIVSFGPWFPFLSVWLSKPQDVCSVTATWFTHAREPHSICGWKCESLNSYTSPHVRDLWGCW